MTASAAHRITIYVSTARDHVPWMRRDLMTRLGPFAVAIAAVQIGWRPRWLGFSPGDFRVQLAFGVGGFILLFFAAAAVQRFLTHRRGGVGVPHDTRAALMEAGYYVLNGPLEEGVFRGLLQGGLGALLAPPVGLVVGTLLYVLYHRLGRWAWQDVAATALLGAPLALAFWLLPGPPSLIGVSLAHIGGTCGFLGPGTYLLRRSGQLGR